MIGRARALGARLVAVLRRRVLEIDCRGGTESKPTIDARDPAVPVEELTVGDDGPQIRLGIEVVARPSDDDLRRLPETGCGAIIEPSRTLVVGHQHAEGRVADLAGELRAIARVGDRPRVDEVDLTGHLKDFLPLEEERAQFGEEEREPLVDLDLRDVGLDLREVGVEREVGGQVRRHPVLDVDPPLGVGVVVDERPARRIERSELDGRERREELEVLAGRKVRHSIKHTHLRQKAGDVAGDPRPDVGLRPARNRARDLEPPAVDLARPTRRIP